MRILLACILLLSIGSFTLNASMLEGYELADRGYRAAEESRREHSFNRILLSRVLSDSILRIALEETYPDMAQGLLYQMAKRRAAGKAPRSTYAAQLKALILYYPNTDSQQITRKIEELRRMIVTHERRR